MPSIADCSPSRACGRLVWRCVRGEEFECAPTCATSGVIRATGDHLWLYRVSGQTKGAIAAMVAVALGIAGYLSADRIAATEEAATFTKQRIVTVVRTTRANAPPQVVTRSQTVTQRGEAEAS